MKYKLTVFAPRMSNGNMNLLIIETDDNELFDQLCNTVESDRMGWASDVRARLEVDGETHICTMDCIAVN